MTSSGWVTLGLLALFFLLLLLLTTKKNSQRLCNAAEQTGQLLHAGRALHNQLPVQKSQESVQSEFVSAVLLAFALAESFELEGR